MKKEHAQFLVVANEFLTITLAEQGGLQDVRKKIGKRAYEKLTGEQIGRSDLYLLH